MLMGNISGPKVVKVPEECGDILLIHGLEVLLNIRCGISWKDEWFIESDGLSSWDSA